MLSWKTTWQGMNIQASVALERDTGTLTSGPCRFTTQIGSSSAVGFSNEHYQFDCSFIDKRSCRDY